jgi:hypothetical protein
MPPMSSSGGPVHPSRAHQAGAGGNRIGAGKQLPGRQLQSRQPGQARPDSAGRKRSGSIFAPGSLLGTGVPKKLPGTKKLPANPAGPGTAEPGAPGGALAAGRRGQAGTAAVEGRVPRQDHAVHRAAPTPRGGPQNKPAGPRAGARAPCPPNAGRRSGPEREVTYLRGLSAISA